MKADARRLPQLLRDLAQLRAVCLYGDDRDAIREYARRIVTAEAGATDDPFRVTECAADDREAIAAALASPSLTGGRSVVWVRHANERMLPLVDQALEREGALLVVEYGESTAKSRLRGVVEKHSRGCIVACYLRASEAQEAIRSALAELAVEAAPGVIESLAAQVDRQGGSGRAIGAMAGLYAGRGGRLELEDLAALSGSVSADNLDRGLLAGLRGDLPELDATLAALFEDGTAPVAVLRSALFHVQRLRAMSLLVAGGRTSGEAGRAMRPPVFFRREEDTEAVLARWRPDDLGRAAATIWAAERRSKASGVPQEALCRGTLSELARFGATAFTKRSDSRSG